MFCKPFKEKRMNSKEIQGKPPSASTVPHHNLWEEFGSAPLAFLMKNPKVTPVFLFGLALAPLLIASVVLTMIFLLGGAE
jgi:hypothetical protein